MIEVLSSDEGSKTDIPAWVAEGRPRARRGRRRGRLRALRGPEGSVTSMPARVVVLGGGVGGTLVGEPPRQGARPRRRTSRSSTRPGCTTYQPGFLYVALGQAKRPLARRATSARSCGGASISRSSERSGSIRTRGPCSCERGGSLEWDYLVARDRGAAGRTTRSRAWRRGRSSSTRSRARERLREELRRFQGGRIQVGIAGIPYKCPPAPVEFMFMVEEYLRKRGHPRPERGRRCSRR